MGTSKTSGNPKQQAPGKNEALKTGSKQQASSQSKSTKSTKSAKKS